MLKIQAIASGSNGNSVLISDGQTNILIDTGISAKRIAAELVASGVFPSEISAVFITHEHTDHIAGLRVFSGKFDVPVYASEGTFYGIEQKDPKYVSCKENRHYISAGEPVQIGSLTILPFSTSHDAECPLAYRVSSADTTAVLFTDSGICTEEMKNYLVDADILYLESNHDVHMLEVGSYTYSLKRRVLSCFGHLSNDDAAEVLESVISPKLKLLILAHLSEENNYPELARVNMYNKLKELGREQDVRLIVAERYSKTEFFQIG